MAYLLQTSSRVLKPLLILAVSLSGGVGAGEVPDTTPQEKAPKPAWQWKAIERLSQRFDPESLRTRAAEQLAEEQAVKKAFPAPAEEIWKVEGSNSGGPIVDRAEGRKTPELFLPSELFDSLMSMGFLRNPSIRTRRGRSWKNEPLHWALAETYGRGSIRHRLRI
jgi:hypothetical protein